MRRAVFAQADAVVGEDKDRRNVGQRGDTNGWSAVIGKDQEGAAVGNHAAVQGHTVDDRSHPMLTHAKVEVSARKGIVGKDGIILQKSVVAGC